MKAAAAATKPAPARRIWLAVSNDNTRSLVIVADHWEDARRYAAQAFGQFAYPFCVPTGPVAQPDVELRWVDYNGKSSQGRRRLEVRKRAGHAWDTWGPA